MELVVAGRQEWFDDIDHHIWGLKNGREELRKEMQGALNIVTSKCLNNVKSLEETLQSKVILIEEKPVRIITKVKEVEEELALWKKAIAQRANVAIPASPKVEVPTPKIYNGTRNTDGIDNFLWGLDQYYKVLDVKAARKVDYTTLYLIDAAIIWWRLRCRDIERDTFAVNSFDDFKRELKKQFYPENAKNETRAKLRRLTHKKK